MANRPSNLDIYRQDPNLGTWDLLCDAGQLEPGSTLYDDALAVAREAMSRVRRNLEIIVKCLETANYVFAWPTNEGLRPTTPLTAPPANTPQLLAVLERKAGHVPLSLRAWWEIIGEVSLLGVFADSWKSTQGFPLNDALEIVPLSYVLEEIEQWEANPERGQTFEAPLSADIYHKANLSGGAEYSVVLPDGRIDAPLRHVIMLIPGPRPGHWAQVETNETFVGYLRRSLMWAGFPGYATAEKPLERDASRVREIASMLIPF
jgi:hypothetical protein